MIRKFDLILKTKIAASPVTLHSAWLSLLDLVIMMTLNDPAFHCCIRIQGCLKDKIPGFRFHEREPNLKQYLVSSEESFFLGVFDHFDPFGDDHHSDHEDGEI